MAEKQYLPCYTVMLYFFDAVINSLLTQNLVVNTFCKLLGEYIHITITIIIVIMILTFTKYLINPILVNRRQIRRTELALQLTRDVTNRPLPNVRRKCAKMHFINVLIIHTYICLISHFIFYILAKKWDYKISFGSNHNLNCVSMQL